MAYEETYLGLVNAVEKYYGAGSDQWLQIAQYGTNAPQFESIVKQLPNYRAVVNQNGDILGWEYFGSENVGTSASMINSNLQSGARDSVQASYPATVKTDPQTGNVTAGKGITTPSGANFIAKKVIPAIAATGMGIQLGKTIDSTLYNANPDFWDSHGMSGLNPQTWSSITCDMDGTAGEVIGATAFNMLFGIDPNTGKVQPYLEETAYGYLADYMQIQGFWEGIGEADNPDHIDLPSNISLPVRFAQGNSITMANVYQYTPSNAGVRFTSFRYDVDGVHWVMASGSPFSVYVTNTISGQVTQVIQATEAVVNEQTIYYVGGQGYNTNTNAYNSCNGNFSAEYDPNIAYIILNGTYSGLEGVGTQAGATLPQLDNNMSIQDVIDALRQQYPEIWDDAITYPVLQPDGTVKDYTYLPVPYPTANSSTDNQPTGDGEYVNQNDWGYDPNTMPSSMWDWLWKIINDVNKDDYDDDTGDGGTPTPTPPTGSASALWRIYNPSQAQVDAFGAWLWSPDFVDQLLKAFNDPMQAIFGLHKVFVTPPVSGSGAIKVGYLSSTASANYVSNQYVDVDCGTVNVTEHFGNVFDYDPYTSIKLYLPFIGIVNLQNSDIMRGQVNVVYHVDVLTGACLAEVKVIRDGAGGTLYTFSGNCAVQYPVSSGSYIGIVTGLLGIAGGIAGTVASGGALAPMLMGAGASVGRMHTDISHSGNISSNAGAMGIKKPYLIIERTQTKMSNAKKKIEGLPESEVITLGSLKGGYAKVKVTHYDGIPCNANELERIRSLLTNGVFIN